jgi:hypothetical protein
MSTPRAFADSVVTGIQASLSTLASGIASRATSLTAIRDDVLAALDNIGAPGAAGSHLDTIDAQSQIVSSEADAVDATAKEIQSVSGDAKTSIQAVQSGTGDLRAAVSSIGGGAVSDQLTTATFDALNDTLDEVEDFLATALAHAQGGSILTAKALSIEANVVAIKSALGTLKGAVDDVSGARQTAEDRTGDLTGVIAALSGDESDSVDISASVQNDLVDPWVITTDKLDELKDHLDDVLADPCGPNLVSVLILAYDLDGFYAPPSRALIKGFEAEMAGKSEPSVVITVSDGSKWLIYPHIEVTFRTSSGISPLKVKETLKSRFLSHLKGRKFGSSLYLGGPTSLYNAVPVDVIEGLTHLNIEITGFSAHQDSGAFLDTDGNLIVPKQEVLTKPVDPDTGNDTLKFYRRISDTKKELI